MTEPKFKPGDRVVCVKPSSDTDMVDFDLSADKIYEIKSATVSHVTLKYQLDMHVEYDISRFKLAEPVKTTWVPCGENLQFERLAEPNHLDRLIAAANELSKHPDKVECRWADPDHDILNGGWLAYSDGDYLEFRRKPEPKWEPIHVKTYIDDEMTICSRKDAIAIYDLISERLKERVGDGHE